MCGREEGLRSDVLSESNSEGHRGPGLRSGNGDTARKVQKEPLHGNITGGSLLRVDDHHHLSQHTTAAGACCASDLTFTHMRVCAREIPNESAQT